MTGGLAVTPGAGTIPLSVTTPAGSTADAINATIGGTANRFRVDQFGSVYGVSMRGASNGKFGSQTSNYTSVLDVTPTGAAQIGAVTRGRVSQTADLAQWQDNAGTVMAKVTAAGAIDATTLTQAGTAVVITTDARLTDARTPTAHATTHNAGGSDALAIDAAAGTGSLRTLGTSSTSAAAGNDARLSDARTPLAHATTHELGGSDELGLSPAQVIGTAVIDSDTRLTDARTPTNAAYGAYEASVWGAPNTVGLNAGGMHGPQSNSVQTSGSVTYSFFRAHRDITVGKIGVSRGTTNPSGVTLSRMGLYTVTGISGGTATLTLVARTNSSALGASSATWYEASFDTAGGYPANYLLTAGEVYAMAIIIVGTTPGSVVAQTGVTTIGLTALREIGLPWATRQDTQTDLPAVYTSAIAYGSTTNPRPAMRLRA